MPSELVSCEKPVPGDTTLSVGKEMFGKMTRDLTHRHPMLAASSKDIVDFSNMGVPRVICIVDAEEEFDWSKQFSTDNISVTTVKAQSKAQNIFSRYNLVP